MASAPEVVITGMGLVSPLGIGNQAVGEALRAGRSGIRALESFDASALPVRIGGEVRGFNPKDYIVQRKTLKVMARDSQIGIAASVLACQDAGIAPGKVDPERFGVVLGADRICGSLEDSEAPYRKCIQQGQFDFRLWGTEGMANSFPLSFLKVLPNMIASHVSIVQDARGPNNTIHQGDVSGLQAIVEAARVIQRGAADVMIAGGASSRATPLDWAIHCVVGRLSRRNDDPATVLRPFDADRSGEVYGEGAAVFVLESRRHAEARHARVLARLLGLGVACEAYHGRAVQGIGLRRAMALALKEARLSPAGIGHVNAHGMSTLADDPVEAHAIRDVAPNVPVTAPRSYFGNLGAAAGAMELAASVFSFASGLVPKTLNYQRPDPECPVPVIREEHLTASRPSALAVNWTRIGQAAAIVLAGAD